jgi:RimJ/RimL family protein N-acetyltransferase
VEGEDKIHRFPYAVHERVEDDKTRFIGMINLRTLSPEECKSPPHDTHGSTATTLSLEIAYMFLPTFWGHGYATESISAVLKTCASAPATLWAPFEKVIIRAIVNDENVPSQRVMQKCGMGEPEVLEFEGGRFFIAGKWRTKHRLFVFAKEFVAA